jgi:hypothetical protein
MEVASSRTACLKPSPLVLHQGSIGSVVRQQGIVRAAFNNLSILSQSASARPSETSRTPAVVCRP